MVVEENRGFFFVFESHEKASVIRMFSSADQRKKPLSISREVGPSENVTALVRGKLSHKACSLLTTEGIGEEISPQCKVSEGSNTNMGQEFDIPSIIIQTRGLRTELKAFQPAWCCHRGEKAPVLIPKFACSPTLCWVFSRHTHTVTPGPGINSSTP